MAVEIERSHWSIVLLGSFNPSIFHPAWFAQNEVISKEHAGTSEVDVIHNEVASVTLGNQIRVTCEAKRFQVEASKAPEILLLDLVSKVFGDLLPHSRVQSFGINKSVHFRASSPEKRTEIGRMFAPTDPWGEFGKRIQSSEGEQVGGLMSLRMREIKNDEDTTGSLEARIEPSPLLDRRSGVFVAVNRHFDIRDYKEGSGAIQAIRKLDQEFAQALRDSDEIIDSIASIST
ncbi:hypothetical protein MUY21_09760 [Aliiroseovarius sp. S2029]|nr:hypothetical protein [Aliiroseovarius sp. S2029]